MVLMSVWPMSRSYLSPWSSFGTRHWFQKFLLPKYWNAKLLPQWVPLMISIINSWAEPVPEGIEIELVTDNRTWEHCWEDKPKWAPHWFLENLSRKKKQRSREVCILGVVPDRLHFSLLVTFDQRRRSLERHRRKWPTSSQHREEHYLQPGLVLMNTLF